MHKCFKFNSGHFAVYFGYFVERKLPCQDHALEPVGCEPCHFLGRAVVGLRTGVQRYWRQLHLQYAHVLHEYGVNARPVKFPYQFFRVLKFVVVYDGIYRYVDFCLEYVGILAQFCDVSYGISCLGPKRSAPM